MNFVIFWAQMRTPFVQKGTKTEKDWGTTNPSLKDVHHYHSILSLKGVDITP
jgi:hypothetical protein